MTSEPILKKQLDYLLSFIGDFQKSTSYSQKLNLLENTPSFKAFFNQNHPIIILYPSLSELERIAVASIIVINQASIVFNISHTTSHQLERLTPLLKELVNFETFYQEMGGIIGYHTKILELLYQQCIDKDPSSIDKRIYQAQGFTLHDQTKEVDETIALGIRALPYMGEIYPIGGASDRLDLYDETTKKPLPLAMLNYQGESLLTRMIKDLQAREHLYFKIFDKQIITPIAMMTSDAKNNHHFVEQICEHHHWYHRPKDYFFLFEQPLAPVLTVEGNWSLLEPLQLNLKPSGHGVIWKLAKEKGLFDWFEKHKRPKALLRQMNNPTASVDYGIFSLIGLGYHEDKAFGFASCQRLVHAAEGVNVLIEQKKNNQYHYTISNIEYTEFKKYNLKDIPKNATSPYSAFPANTNILFIDLPTVKETITHCPIPGMLINMKSDVPFIDSDGKKHMVKGGRLESTMQNIADYITTSFDKPQNVESNLNLKTFLTYNVRHKTISVAKKSYRKNGPINETPEGCYYTLLQNNVELFAKYCMFSLPPLCSPQEFIDEGPSVHITYHPALGPIYSIIAQKIQQGTLAKNSVLMLDISELEIFNLKLNGALIVQAEHPMGHMEQDHLLHYSHQSGKCTLINVTFENKGIDSQKKNSFWKNDLHFSEKFKLHLGKNSEFYAKDVVFKGDFEIHVPPNTKMIAKMAHDQTVLFEQHSLTKPSWHWHYQIDASNRIVLTKHSAS